MDKENIEIKNNKSSTILSVIGIIFLVIGAIFGGICFVEVIKALATNNDIGLAFLILALIIYGGVGLVSSLISLILNVFAYKKSNNQKTFKLIVMILSIVVLVMTISSFAIWVIGANSNNILTI